MLFIQVAKEDFLTGKPEGSSPAVQTLREEAGACYNKTCYLSLLIFSLVKLQKEKNYTE